MLQIQSKTPLKEQEIKKSWPQGEAPLVSVQLQTYNQVDYIEEAIKSILNQKTSFCFEVLIHDDCSTDGTSEIVKYYCENYPDIIKPIIQTENQYSKGLHIGKLNTSRAKGMYLAFCEGDDYWVDELKLQKQVNILNENPSQDLLFTSSFKVNHFSEVIGDISRGSESRVFSAQKVILKDGGFMPSPSLFYRKEVIGKIPEYVRHAIGRDYFLQVIGALRGGALYLDDRTCAYRVNAKNSWSAGLTLDVRIQHTLKTCYVIDLLCKDFRKFAFALKLAKAKRIFRLATLLLIKGKILKVIKLFDNLNKSEYQLNDK